VIVKRRSTRSELNLGMSVIGTNPKDRCRLQPGRYRVVNGPEQVALHTIRNYCNIATLDPAKGMSRVIPSAALQRCNTSIRRSGSQFARLGQKPHHFGHRIADDDPRRPTSAGLKMDKVTPARLHPTLGDW